MKIQGNAKNTKPTKTERVTIGATVYIVNSYNDNFPKKVVEEKIIEMIKHDISKNT